MELPPRLLTIPAVSAQKVTYAYDADGSLKDGFPLAGSLFFTQSYTKRGEWMDSVNGDSYNSFKPCSHFTSGCSVYNGIDRKRYFRDASNGDWGYVVYKNASGDLWPQQLGEVDAPINLSVDSVPALFYLSSGFRQVALPKDWNYLRERALRTLLPQIRPKLSILNALYELKDFKRFFETASHLTTSGSVRELYRRIKTVYRPKRGDHRTLRQYLRASAGGYLQAQFNVLPLLKDLTGLGQVIQSVRRQVQDLLDRERAPQVRHFETPLDSTIYADTTANVDFVPADAAQATLDGLPTATRIVRYNRAVFNATIRYSYTLSGWERNNALLGGFLDGVGANLNPAIIWNAIPWTFVLDWVVNINNFLEQYKFRWLEPVCTIDDFCASITIDREIECLLDLNHGGTRSEGQVVASRIHEKAYRRSIEFPDFYSSVRTSGLNSSEFSLSAALVASRL